MKRQREFVKIDELKAWLWDLPPHLDFDRDEGILIYALADPRDGSVRYVGKTNDRARRLEQHTEARRGNRKLKRWLKELREAKMSPRMLTLGLPSRRGWAAAERTWIAFFEARRWRLYNLEAGGRQVWRDGYRGCKLAPVVRRWRLEKNDRRLQQERDDPKKPQRSKRQKRHYPLPDPQMPPRPRWSFEDQPLAFGTDPVKEGGPRHD